MFDIKWIRDNPEALDDGLRRRGEAPCAAELLDLDEKRRGLQTTLQEARQRRNDASREIGAAKKNGEDAGALMDEVASLKERISALEEEERTTGEALEARLAGLPNIPDPEVPVGEDESANQLVRSHDAPPVFPFTPRDHTAIGEALGLMDFERAARMSGARFNVLRGALARMERALAQFMLDLHTEHFGYEEVNPPALVRDNALYGTGQLPKFAEDLFQTTDGRWLIPTAEVPLANLHAEEILDADDLPRRYAAMTWCFRSEAGAAGKDTRGMIRQHQFNKVELVSITHPDRSAEELERMTGCAETVLQRLGIPYRVMMLSTGDMGFAARRTYDIEVWLPGAETYREISSCSNTGDFQARRMNSRFRPGGEKGTRTVHTLNGSGVAVGRALIAVLENYQQSDGSVIVPQVLQPYMGGTEVITPHV